MSCLELVGLGFPISQRHCELRAAGLPIADVALHIISLRRSTSASSYLKSAVMVLLDIGTQGLPYDLEYRPKCVFGSLLGRTP